MIEIQNLTKKFGSIVALNDVNLKIEKGETIGLLGVNGAGKSTLMNIITGFLSTTEGNVIIDGKDILDDPYGFKKSVGYLPETPPIYPEMTVDEYLNFVYELKNCNLNKRAHLKEVCMVSGISDVRGRVIGHLSKGYRQRIGIAQALIGNPEIIILDEPTSGLDPKQVVDIRNLIRTLSLNHIVIVSTHVLSEIQALCDRIVVIDHGKIIADEKTEELSNALPGNKHLKINICGPEKQVLSAIKGINGVIRAESKGQTDGDSTSYNVECDGNMDLRKVIFRTMASNDWPIINFQSESGNLEDVFLSLMKKSQKRSTATKQNVKRSGSTYR